MPDHNSFSSIPVLVSMSITFKVGNLSGKDSIVAILPIAPIEIITLES
jgi:hypothetical protein